MDNNRTFWTKYDQSSLTKKIGSLPSKALYLVHTPGDLIHLDQSLRLSRALVDQGILFKQQVSWCHLLESLMFDHLTISDLSGERGRQGRHEAHVQVHGELPGRVSRTHGGPFPR